MEFKTKFNQGPIIKPMFNIGALLDIPTGNWVTGLHGESILNGGLGYITGMVGIGNNFKSTILHYMMLSAFGRVCEAYKTNMMTYDTEVNIHENRLLELTKRIPAFKDSNVIDDKSWVITDKTVYSGDKYFDLLKEDLEQKTKNAKDYTVATPFPDRDGKSPFKMLLPTFGEVDSLTEFQSKSELKMLDENSLGDAGANTFHMRSGLIKHRFLMEIPQLAGSAYYYIGITGQLGKDIAIPSGSGGMAVPVKKLQYLKYGDKMKGVTDKFSFATNNCWHAYNASPLINQSTKEPEYPNDLGSFSGDTDLNLVSLKMLRSKSGPTGYGIDLIVSQREGVLPELSEFHFIKTLDRYGISGTLQHYALDLYPSCKLQRTTVRNKIDTDPFLRRAINITAELCEMKYFMPHVEILEPKVLYDTLEKKGYDWKQLLATRGYWTLNNETHPVPFLSTLDLVNMAMDKYKPYWMKEK